jgi:hypothetical protein
MGHAAPSSNGNGNGGASRTGDDRRMMDADASADVRSGRVADASGIPTTGSNGSSLSSSSTAMRRPRRRSPFTDERLLAP